MPITTRLHEAEHISIIELSGHVPAHEIDALVRDAILPFIVSQKPHHAYVIFDFTSYAVDIVEVIKYMNMVAKRRRGVAVPDNFSQYFIGDGRWVERFQSWMLEGFGSTTHIFETLDEALQHIKKSSQV